MDHLASFQAGTASTVVTIGSRPRQTVIGIATWCWEYRPRMLPLAQQQPIKAVRSQSWLFVSYFVMLSP